VPNKDNVAELIQKAQTLLNQRLHQEARALFLQALEVRPDHPDAHYGLATACFLQGDVLGAAHHFKEVTRHDPLRAGAFVNLGALYNHLGREDDAVAALRRGIQLDPNRAEGYYNLGLVYRRIGKLDLAVEAYREAVRLQPGLAEANFNLANAFLEAEKFDQAVSHYRAALKTRPNWPEAQQGLATAEAGIDDQHKSAPAPETVVETHHEPAERVPKGDPPRPLDPARHGVLMSELHRDAAEAEAIGKTLGGEVAHNLETAIKELSQCFLRPDVPLHELETRLKTFEASAQHLHLIHVELEHIHHKIEAAAEDLKKKA
jgi:tetratricopeptide (TPR) repeat protein